LKEEFSLVDNKETIKILKKRFCLDKNIEHPVVFGSFTEWNSFVAMKLHQFGCIVAAANTD
jgi:hypothetical protein